MTNFNAQPASETPPSEHSWENFDTTNLVGVLDVLVQMDLALNGLKNYPKPPAVNSDNPGESA